MSATCVIRRKKLKNQFSTKSTHFPLRGKVGQLCKKKRVLCWTINIINLMIYLIPETYRRHFSICKLHSKRIFPQPQMSLHSIIKLFFLWVSLGSSQFLKTYFLFKHIHFVQFLPSLRCCFSTTHNRGSGSLEQPASS